VAAVVVEELTVCLGWVCPYPFCPAFRVETAPAVGRGQAGFSIIDHDKHHMVFKH